MISKEDMFYSNGYPVCCPFTKTQCKNSCILIKRSKEGYYQKGLYICPLDGRRRVMSNKTKYTEQAVYQIKKGWLK